MVYTKQDFMRDVITHILTEAPEEVLANLSPDQRLTGLSPDQVLSRFSLDQRLMGLSPDQRLRGLSREQMLELSQLVKQKVASTSKSPPGRKSRSQQTTPAKSSPKNRRR